MAKEIEQVHLNFCKRLFHVKRTTQNDFVYGELGRYPMYIFRYCRIISYWLKIITGQNPFIYHCYKFIMNHLLILMPQQSIRGLERSELCLLRVVLGTFGTIKESVL